MGWNSVGIIQMGRGNTPHLNPLPQGERKRMGVFFSNPKQKGMKCRRPLPPGERIEVRV